MYIWDVIDGGDGIDGDDSFHDGHGYHDDGEVDDYIDNLVGNTMKIAIVYIQC
jgi:hypothetical protein